METNEYIKVVVIRGSVRPGNYTGRVAAEMRETVAGATGMVREDADA